MNKPYKMSVRSETREAEVFLYGDIEKYEYVENDVTSYSFASEIKALTDVDTIYFRINSDGGVVSEGLAIFNLIKDLKQKTIAIIDGFACSISSVIPMACDEIHMNESSLMMIHKPWTNRSGNADDFRREASILDTVLEPTIKAYLRHCTISREELLQMLDNGDTWLTPTKALEMGFCTKILENEVKQSLQAGYVLSLIKEIETLKTPKTTKQQLNEYFA